MKADNSCIGSLYPLFLILCLILYFGFPSWIANIKNAQNFKFSWLLIGCSNSVINTLIG